MRSPGRRRGALVLVLVAAALAGGCGGGNRDEKNAYIARVTQAQNTFAGQLERITPTLTASARLDPQALKDLDRATRVMGAQLQAAAPPSEVRSLHGDLVREVRDYGDVVARAGRGAAGEAQLTRATTELSTAMTETLTSISRKLHG